MDEQVITPLLLDYGLIHIFFTGYLHIFLCRKTYIHLRIYLDSLYWKMSTTNVLESVIRRNADNSERIMRNALGYIVSDNTHGILADSSFDNTVSVEINNLICKMLVSAARSAVRDIDSTNDLKFLRIATKKFEYLVATEDEFTIVVVQ